MAKTQLINNKAKPKSRKNNFVLSPKKDISTFCFKTLTKNKKYTVSESFFIFFIRNLAKDLVPKVS